jgi:hypothetical protein
LDLDAIERRPDEPLLEVGTLQNLIDERPPLRVCRSGKPLGKIIR